MWTIREERDGELSDDDDEIQNARKMLMRFSDKDRLSEEELYQLSQNVKAKWDRDEPNEGYVSEYEDSSNWIALLSQERIKMMIAQRRTNRRA